MTIQVDLLEQMLRRNDWRKAAEFLVSSLGGNGFGTPGGEVASLDGTGAIRNALDLGNGNALISGQLTVTGSLNLNATLNMSTKGFRWGAVQRPTTTYVMAAGDSLIYANATGGAFNVTLNRNVVSSGFTCCVLKSDSSVNAVTVLPDFGTINGATSLALSTQFQSAIFSYDSAGGPMWRILGSH